MYLNDRERRVVDKSLAEFENLTDVERDLLTSLFGVYQMYTNPNQTNIRRLILTIARYLLLDQPRPLIELMKSGIPQLHVEYFWAMLTIPMIDLLFREQLPTPRKVCSVMQYNEDDAYRQNELNCFHFLQEYVMSLDQEDLEAFLLFVTGSTIMPRNICVYFRNISGLARCPVAHTCSNTLELPSSYSSTQDLKREFTRILHDSESFTMTLA